MISVFYVASTNFIFWFFCFQKRLSFPFLCMIRLWEISNFFVVFFSTRSSSFLTLFLGYNILHDYILTFFRQDSQICLMCVLSNDRMVIWDFFVVFNSVEINIWMRSKLKKKNCSILIRRFFLFSKLSDK